MLIQSDLRKAATLAAALILASAAVAQSTPPCTLGLQNFFGYGVGSRTGAPYTATVKTTFEQKLADGNTVHGFTIVREARDSAGRTRSEQPRECFLGEDGQPHLQLSISIQDTASKSSTHWETGGFMGKVAWVSHYNQAPQHTPTAAEIEEQRAWSKRHQIPSSEFKHEKLDGKIIAGVPATGYRSTRTLPAGAEGNDLPLITITERWESRELGVTLLHINDDPRRGKSTTEVIELTRGEPDPSLFTPPAGYTIEEQKTITTVVQPSAQQP